MTHNNVVRVDHPLPWFADALMYRTGLPDYYYSVVQRWMVGYSEVPGVNSSCERFYLTNNSDWWVCIQEALRLETFEEAISNGTNPTLETIPVVALPGFESTYEHLLQYFIPDEVPWTKFGLQRLPNGWHTLVIPNPRTTLPNNIGPNKTYEAKSFEHWVRDGIKLKLIPRVFGSRSRDIEFRVCRNVTDERSVVDAILTLLPDFLSRWAPIYEEKSRYLHNAGLDTKLLRNGDASERPLDQLMRRYVTEYQVWSYIQSEFLPAMRAGNGYAVIGFERETGLQIGIATVRSNNGPENEMLHLEMVMRRHGSIWNSYSIIPLLFVHTIREAFWGQYTRYIGIDVMSNFDKSVDNYKHSFNPVLRPIPGLRWLEPRYLK